MKRMHIHVFIDDLQKSINFYSNLFGSEPTKIKDDYAKWMLDDPMLNFAVSSRGSQPGIDHLGIQVEEAGELENMREQLKNADMQTFAEGETVCCYAKSDKTWVKDPSGIAWETYMTMKDAEFFNDSSENDSPELNERNTESMGCC